MPVAEPPFALATWSRCDGLEIGGTLPEAQFPIYSVTKVFIAVCILKLVEQGRLVLDAPLPHQSNLPELASGITLRQVLSHTSGLPDYGGVKAYHEAVRQHPGNPWTFRQRPWGIWRPQCPGRFLPTVKRKVSLDATTRNGFRTA